MHRWMVFEEPTVHASLNTHGLATIPNLYNRESFKADKYTEIVVKASPFSWNKKDVKSRTTASDMARELAETKYDWKVDQSDS